MQLPSYPTHKCTIRTILNDNPLVKNNDMIRNLDHLLGMCDNNNRKATTRSNKLFNRLAHNLSTSRVQTRRRFVENEDLGLAQKSARNDDTLLLAA